MGLVFLATPASIIAREISNRTQNPHYNSAFTKTGRIIDPCHWTFDSKIDYSRLVVENNDLLQIGKEQTCKFGVSWMINILCNAFHVLEG